MAVKPNLALIPSGVKASKVYSVLPTDGTGDFDFSRSGSATRINKDGLIETVASNVPRLNYPLIEGEVSGCPSLLLEPERRNLVQYSEDFINWNLGSSTIISNQEISPNGTLNADLVSSVSINGNVSTSHTVSNNSLTTTQSIFVKHISGTSNFMLRGAFVGGTATAKASKFNLENGSVISTDTTASIEYYGNGWYRVSQQISNNSSGNTTLIFQNFTTNDTISTNELLLWGAMSEVGSYATSYIPNYGTALGITRSAETCNNAGNSNVFNDSEGVLMAEVSALANDGTSRRISISAGNTNNNNLVSLIYGASNRISPSIYSGGSFQMGGDYTLPNQTETIKVALKYSTNDAALWVNGLEVLTDTSVTTPLGLDQIKFEYGNGSNKFYGNTKQLQYFNTALTDAELEKLTSYDSFRDMAIAGQYKTY